jgi:hypothetical protein
LIDGGYLARVFQGAVVAFCRLVNGFSKGKCDGLCLPRCSPDLLMRVLKSTEDESGKLGVREMKLVLHLPSRCRDEFCFHSFLLSENAKGEQGQLPHSRLGQRFMVLDSLRRSLFELVDEGARLFAGEKRHLDAKDLEGLLIQILGVQVEIPAKVHDVVELLVGDPGVPIPSALIPTVSRAPGLFPAIFLRGLLRRLEWFLSLLRETPAIPIAKMTDFLSGAVFHAVPRESQ